MLGNYVITNALKCDERWVMNIQWRFCRNVTYNELLAEQNTPSMHKLKYAASCSLYARNLMYIFNQTNCDSYINVYYTANIIKENLFVCFAFP